VSQNLNGKGPAFHDRAEMRDLQMESDIQSLGHRVTIVSILIPCLFCVVLVFAYLDMRQRLSQIQNIESTNVQALYADVLDKVESLSGKYKDIEQSLLARLEALEKSSSSIDEDLKENRQKIKELVLSKGDKKALEKMARDRLKGIGDRLSSLQEDMATYRSTVEDSLSNITNKLEKETTDLTAYRKDFQVWKDRIAGVSQAVEAVHRKGLQLDLAFKLLSEAKVDKKKWDAFLKEEKEWKVPWEEKIQFLENDMLSLEKQLIRLRARYIHGADDSKLQPGDESPEKTLQPAPGGIIEQDISQ